MLLCLSNIGSLPLPSTKLDRIDSNLVSANNRILDTKNILLLEGGKKHDYQVREKYSNRVVALNQQTRTLLSSIGAWKHIEAVRYTPVKKMQV